MLCLTVALAVTVRCDAGRALAESEAMHAAVAELGLGASPLGLRAGVLWTLDALLGLALLYCGYALVMLVLEKPVWGMTLLCRAFSVRPPEASATVAKVEPRTEARLQELLDEVEDRQRRKAAADPRAPKQRLLYYYCSLEEAALINLGGLAACQETPVLLAHSPLNKRWGPTWPSAAWEDAVRAVVSGRADAAETARGEAVCVLAAPEDACELVPNRMDQYTVANCRFATGKAAVRVRRILILADREFSEPTAGYGDTPRAKADLQKASAQLTPRLLACALLLLIALVVCLQSGPLLGDVPRLQFLSKAEAKADMLKQAGLEPALAALYEYKFRCNETDYQREGREMVQLAACSAVWHEVEQWTGKGLTNWQWAPEIIASMLKPHGPADTFKDGQCTTKEDATGIFFLLQAGHKIADRADAGNVEACREVLYQLAWDHSLYVNQEKQNKDVTLGNGEELAVVVDWAEPNDRHFRVLQVGAGAGGALTPPMAQAVHRIRTGRRWGDELVDTGGACAPNTDSDEEFCRQKTTALLALPKDTTKEAKDKHCAERGLCKYEPGALARHCAPLDAEALVARELTTAKGGKDKSCEGRACRLCTFRSGDTLTVHLLQDDQQTRSLVEELYTENVQEVILAHMRSFIGTGGIDEKSAKILAKGIEGLAALVNAYAKYMFTPRAYDVACVESSNCFCNYDTNDKDHREALDKAVDKHEHCRSADAPHGGSQMCGYDAANNACVKTCFCPYDKYDVAMHDDLYKAGDKEAHCQQLSTACTFIEGNPSDTLEYRKFFGKRTAAMTVLVQAMDEYGGSGDVMEQACVLVRHIVTHDPELVTMKRYYSHGYRSRPVFAGEPMQRVIDAINIQVNAPKSQFQPHVIDNCLRAVTSYAYYNVGEAVQQMGKTRLERKKELTEHRAVNSAVEAILHAYHLGNYSWRRADFPEDQEQAAFACQVLDMLVDSSFDFKDPEKGDDPTANHNRLAIALLASQRPHTTRTDKKFHCASVLRKLATEQKHYDLLERRPPSVRPPGVRPGTSYDVQHDVRTRVAPPMEDLLLALAKDALDRPDADPPRRGAVAVLKDSLHDYEGGFPAECCAGKVSEYDLELKACECSGPEDALQSLVTGSVSNACIAEGLHDDADDACYDWMEPLDKQKKTVCEVFSSLLGKDALEEAASNGVDTAALQRSLEAARESTACVA